MSGKPAGAPAVVVDRVGKTFHLPRERTNTLKERALHPLRRGSSERFEALRDVSFAVQEGEFFGIVGRNGSGKSTLLKCLAGIYRADGGEIYVNGRMSTFIELGVGFNPDLAARDNVTMNAIMLGLSPARGAGALRPHHRLRRARGVRRPEAQELLLGDARAPGVLGDDPGRRRHPADRRGAGGGRRVLPAEVLRRLQPDEGRGPHDPLRHARHVERRRGSATARCCSSGARWWRSTNPTRPPPATSR